MTVVHNPTPEPLAVARTDEIYAQAFELAYGPSRRAASILRVVNFAYWSAVILTLGWIGAMAVDRAPPVLSGPREVMNAGKRVAAGEALLVKSTRKRIRSCEMTRRWYIVDGNGRRFDFEPERFDAYGPVLVEGQEPEPEITGPVIPLDAAPGRGRWFSVIAHDCNLLQRALGWSIVTIYPPLEFEIVARKP